MMENESDAQLLEMPDAEVLFWPNLFSASESRRYFQDLVANIAWRQDPIKIFGRVMQQPRLTAWYGDPDRVYTYSNIRMEPQPWTATLQEIRQRVEATADAPFNSVLLNLYRDGRDSMGWHSDDEPELGTNPIIASVSFGATRRFHFRHRSDRLQRISVDLTSGSLLLMRGATQHHWQHQIPKSARPLQPRINLTFRLVGEK